MRVAFVVFLGRVAIFAIGGSWKLQGAAAFGIDFNDLRPCAQEGQDRNVTKYPCCGNMVVVRERRVQRDALFKKYPWAYVCRKKEEGEGEGEGEGEREGAPCSGKNKHIRYIATNGSDQNSGCSPEEPLATVRACATAVGDDATCYLLPGRYHQSTVISDVEGLTIAAAPNASLGSVIMDGTIPLTGWSSQGDTYRSSKRHDVWQLFWGGEPLTSARWPNAAMWSTDAWDPSISWARQAHGSSCGRSVDKGTVRGKAQTLAATRMSMNGCNVIMNNEHWVTRRYVVKDHQEGTSTFSYELKQKNHALCERYGKDLTHSKYYIDGCIAALDAAGEWAYDSSGHIVVRPPASAKSLTSVRGKNQTYAIALKDCPRAIIKGITFFATAVLLWRSTASEVRDNEFLYSSASRRALGGDAEEFDVGKAFSIPQLRKAEVTEIKIPGNFLGEAYQSRATRYLVANNRFYRSEGSALRCFRCSYDTFENNEITEAGYPTSHALQLEGIKCDHQIYRRNTLKTDGGGGIGQLWGFNITATLNHVQDSGKLLVDNQCIGGGKPSRHCSMSYNWLHESTGLGLRFDAGEDGNFGDRNDFRFNVAWHNLQGGLSDKSQRSIVYRNTIISNQGGSDPESGGAFGSAPDMKIARCYPARCVATTGPKQGVMGSAITNKASIIRSNVGGMDPGTIGYGPNDLPGTHDHNLNLLVKPATGILPSLDQLFRDWRNWDFRPASHSKLIDAGARIKGTEDRSVIGSSPDIGAYEAGGRIYWIPGRQTGVTSTPIPPQAAVNVRPDAALMFLQAKGAARHSVLLGTSENALVVQQPELIGENNIFLPHKRLIPGTTYFWRVDSVFVGGLKHRGEIWNFTVGCADLSCYDCGNNVLQGTCRRCGSGLVAQRGRCAPAGGCLRGSFEVTAVPQKYGRSKPFRVERGNYNDTFAVVSSESKGCAKHHLRVLRLVHNSKNVLGSLSCSNQEYQIETKFECHQCADGFRPYKAAKSKCAPTSSS